MGILEVWREKWGLYKCGGKDLSALGKFENNQSVESCRKIGMQGVEKRPNERNIHMRRNLYMGRNLYVIEIIKMTKS
jgi:hypothetical protein